MDIDKTTRLTPENGWHHALTLQREEARALGGFMLLHDGCKGYHIEIFTSGASGIGRNVVIRCLCGEGRDITNYMEW